MTRPLQHDEMHAASAFDLLHADAALIVADKPSGLLAVPGRGEALQDCLARRVQARFADARVVHRLDMATSGLMLFARGPVAQRDLARAFEQRHVFKRYEAIVEGRVAEDHGEIDLPLICDWPRRPKQRVDPILGKPSLTRWRVLSRDAQRNTTRLALEPVTGRSHQLRVHLQAIGHAIVGDALYADAPMLAPAQRMMLHACAITLPHPLTGTAMGFQSAVPF
jgi:tRNA pseudouridine32 synthase / 23S rRNA pseudouridine746 synthase